jgi:hypothetical protein
MTWRRDLAVATAANVEELRAPVARARARRVVVDGAWCEALWRSTVRYRYDGPRHVIRSWGACRAAGGACADAAAFVAAVAYLVGEGEHAVVCLEEHTLEPYRHARVNWRGRTVDPTSEYSRPTLGGCMRLASALELVGAGRRGVAA